MLLIWIHSFPRQIPNGPSLRGCFNIFSSLIVFSSRWIDKRWAVYVYGARSSWWSWLKWWLWLVCHWIIVRSKIVRIVGLLIIFRWILILICKIVIKATTLSATSYRLCVIIVCVGEFQLTEVSFSLYWIFFWHRNCMAYCNRTKCNQQTPQLHFRNIFSFRFLKLCKNWQKTANFSKISISTFRTDFNQKSRF